VVDLYGEGFDLSLTDIAPLQVYHKIDTLDYTESKFFDGGQPGTFRTEKASCRMVFMGDTARLKLYREDVLAAAMADFPLRLPPSFVSSNGMMSCTIEVTRVDTNALQIYSTEFKGVESEVTPSTFVFQIYYTITDSFGAGCFQLC
jgi:hypothetical protein